VVKVGHTVSDVIDHKKPLVRVNSREFEAGEVGEKSKRKHLYFSKITKEDGDWIPGKSLASGGPRSVTDTIQL